MTRSLLLLPLLLACASISVATHAEARMQYHRVPFPATQWAATPNHTQAVVVGGTYAGSDPDPNIRAALAREFGKRR